MWDAMKQSRFEIECAILDFKKKKFLYLRLHVIWCLTKDIVHNCRVQFTAYRREMDIAGSPDKLQQINVKVRKQYQATRKVIFFA